MTKKQYLLVINSGSATIKFKIFHQADLHLALSGIFERIGLHNSFYNIQENSLNKKIIAQNFPDGVKSHAQALSIILEKISPWRDKIKYIGHRIVHGGEQFKQSVVVNQAKLKKIERYNQLAPLHNPINVACLKVCLQKFSPATKNIAVFDTAFYKDIPDYAYMYALPYEYYAKYQVRRYGFHGISHKYVSQLAAYKLKKPLNKLKLITCHLGSGASISAIKYGRAIETSMGFTPLEGLTMGTRSGDIDPAAVLYLMKILNIGPGKMEDILNKESGLLGIFGYSGDMRDIMVASGYQVKGFQAAKKFNQLEQAKAKLALKMFIYDIRRYIGSFAAILGGVDAIVFTAGIGERNATIRRLVTSNLKLNNKYKVLAIPTNEELMIAQEVLKAV